MTADRLSWYAMTAARAWIGRAVCGGVRLGCRRRSASATASASAARKRASARRSAVATDPALSDMFDAGYSVTCRDAALPVGKLYKLRDAGNPAARLAALARQGRDLRAASGRVRSKGSAQSRSSTAG